MQNHHAWFCPLSVLCMLCQFTPYALPANVNELQLVGEWLSLPSTLGLRGGAEMLTCPGSSTRHVRSVPAVKPLQTVVTAGLHCLPESGLDWLPKSVSQSQSAHALQQSTELLRGDCRSSLLTINSLNISHSSSPSQSGMATEPASDCTVSSVA